MSLFTASDTVIAILWFLLSTQWGAHGLLPQAAKSGLAGGSWGPCDLLPPRALGALPSLPQVAASVPGDEGPHTTCCQSRSEQWLLRGLCCQIRTLMTAGIYVSLISKELKVLHRLPPAQPFFSIIRFNSLAPPSP